MSTAPALSVRELRVRIANRGPLSWYPVRGLDFDLFPGTVTGLAGESGCGKTLSLLALLGLLPPGVEASSERLQLGNHDLRQAREPDWRAVRGTTITAIFQDPFTALDPVLQTGAQIAAVIRRRQRLARNEARRQVLAALAGAGFADPERIARSYPHELSGGMRQLVCYAMAAALKPAVLLADEPTTALDVVSQAHMLQQLRRLADSQGTAVLLVSHDLAVMGDWSDQLLLMYHGRVVEQGPSQALLQNPAHPYTAALLDAVPGLDGEAASPVRPIPGQAPALSEDPEACAFAPRCARVAAACRDSRPLLTTAPGRPASQVACRYPL